MFFLPLPVRRGSRCPVRAHAVTVGAFGADSAALVGLEPARQNSLRACRQALRSNSCRESVNEAHACGVRTGSSPTSAAATEIALPGHRLPRQPAWWENGARTSISQQSRGRGARCASFARRLRFSLSWPRAQRASFLIRRGCPNGAPPAARSEFHGGPWQRKTQGSRRLAPTASWMRNGRPGCGFAARSSERLT
jgi:hypothetical protein